MPTTVTQLIYQQSEDPPLGLGGYGQVYRATEKGSGKLVAVKKSRAPRKVQNTLLDHETKLLRLLAGHPAIPAIYGHGRMDHFEYMALELLGPSIQSLRTKGAGVMVGTVASVVIQTLGALSHIHGFGIVHRDIKPHNILVCLHDPSVVKVIDFGLAKPFSLVEPPVGSPLRDVVGTTCWASLNSQNGLDLGPRDDLESLAYTALSLLRGELPWKERHSKEGIRWYRESTRLTKQAYPGHIIGDGFPIAFGQLLEYSRQLRFAQIPDYPSLVASFTQIVPEPSSLLDWSPTHPKINTLHPIAPPIPSLTPSEVPTTPPDLISDRFDDSTYSFLIPSDSYSGWDLSQWDYRQTERDKELTLPPNSYLCGEVGLITAIEPV